MAKKKRPTRKQYVAAAQRQYQRDGEIEIDEGAKLSDGNNPDGGEYVAAWVWVYDESARKEIP